MKVEGMGVRGKSVRRQRKDGQNIKAWGETQPEKERQTTKLNGKRCE